MFSNLQHFTKWIGDKNHGAAIAMTHLKFMCDIYKSQMNRGKLFLHERPASASSWRERCALDTMMHGNVKTTLADQCMFGLKSKIHGIPMRKITRTLTNAPGLVRRLRGHHCDRCHAHQAIRGSEGGVKRSVWAQCYPPGLVEVLACSCISSDS